jgi:hypothetical protein
MKKTWQIIVTMDTDSISDEITEELLADPKANETMMEMFKSNMEIFWPGSQVELLLYTEDRRG